MSIDSCLLFCSYVVVAIYQSWGCFVTRLPTNVPGPKVESGFCERIQVIVVMFSSSFSGRWLLFVPVIRKSSDVPGIRITYYR